MPATRRALLATGLLAAGAAQAQAQAGPLRLLVGYPAGGGTDLVARALGERLGRVLGAPVVTDNRPGANTIIATQAALAAPAEGTTLLQAGSATLVVNPLLYRRLPYDAERDLVTLAVSNGVPLVVVVNPSLPATTLAELTALAHRRAAGPEGPLPFASNGLGNPTHLAAEMYAAQAGLRLTHVPFQGSSRALISVLNGDTPLMVDTIGSALPYIRDGRLRALGVTTPARLAVLPQVPTVAEQGFPGFDASFWYGIAVGARVPLATQQRLHAALAEAMADDAFRTLLASLGLSPEPPRSLAELASFVAADRARWAGVIRASGITLE